MIVVYRGRCGKVLSVSDISTLPDGDSSGSIDMHVHATSVGVKYTEIPRSMLMRTIGTKICAAGTKFVPWL